MGPNLPPLQGLMILLVNWKAASPIASPKPPMLGAGVVVVVVGIIPPIKERCSISV